MKIGKLSTPIMKRSSLALSKVCVFPSGTCLVLHFVLIRFSSYFLYFDAEGALVAASHPFITSWAVVGLGFLALKGLHFHKVIF